MRSVGGGAVNQRLQEMSDDEDELDEDVFGGSYRGHDLEVRPSVCSVLSATSAPPDFHGAMSRCAQTRGWGLRCAVASGVGGGFRRGGG